MSTKIAHKNIVVLAGDSTVAVHSGWGPAFASALKPEITMVNLAQGGRSSRSFRTEGWWDQVLEQKPDFVLIQFGHNDCPGKGPERESTPEQFAEHIGRYVDEVRAIGGVPVLITSLARRDWDEAGRIQSTLTAYAEATKAVAREKGTALVDLHTRSIEQYERDGVEVWRSYSPPAKEGEQEDRTHLNQAGGAAVAPLVIDELRVSLPVSEGWFLI